MTRICLAAKATVALFLISISASLNKLMTIEEKTKQLVAIPIVTGKVVITVVHHNKT
ncbi:MAG: hypothetical protein HOC09_29890 [Deltaproteobacteria bacterium]|jgi:hypothetical protein|nr:hypothetical protein [Deltaproteobacteria bacterium]